MAGLDMTDVLTDFDLTDSFSVVQTARSLATGVPVDSAQTQGPYRSPVIPDPAMLKRMDDGSRLEASITVYSKVRLTAGHQVDAQTWRLADIIVWHGNTYTVRAAQDWSAFGSGWWRAVADLNSISPLNT